MKTKQTISAGVIVFMAFFTFQFAFHTVGCGSIEGEATDSTTVTTISGEI